MTTAEVAVAPAATRARGRAEREGAPVPLLFRIIAVITFIYLLVPAVIVVLAGLNSGNYLTFPPQGLSLKWVQVVPDLRHLSPGLSLQPPSRLRDHDRLHGPRHHDRHLPHPRLLPGPRLVRAFFLAPLLLPGLVIGLALYVYYLNLPFLPLSRTFWRHAGRATSW